MEARSMVALRTPCALPAANVQKPKPEIADGHEVPRPKHGNTGGPPSSLRRAGVGAAPRGFTLVELLVVIGIIAVLMSIVLPSLAKARAHANQVACASNLRQLMMGFQMFANEHQGSLPGGWFDRLGAGDEWKQDWLFGGQSDYRQTPDAGTLYPYINSRSVYRCRALSAGKPGSCDGSNGYFDYALFLAWPGAKITNIRPESRFYYRDGRVETVPTPILVEEDPRYYINASNIDSGHASIDRMSHVHRGGSNYGGIDCSVQWFKEPPDASTLNWFSQAPSGRWVPLGPDNYQMVDGVSVEFGWWNIQ